MIAGTDHPGTLSLDGVPGWILSSLGGGDGVAGDRPGGAATGSSGRPGGGSPIAGRQVGASTVRGSTRREDLTERGRPGFPRTLVDLLVRAGCLTPTTRVVDLAAGTGRLSRQLRRVSPCCIAVEPSATMRAVLRVRVPGVPVVAGAAESLPLASGSADLVTVGDAFHWFDARRSLAEIARVLRPGGWLALIWNERDESEPWVAELNRLLRSSGDAPYARAVDYLPVLEASPEFVRTERRTMAFSEPADRIGLVDLVASRTCVNALGPSGRAAIRRRAAGVVATVPEPIAVPYRTEMLLARAAA